VLRRVRQSEEAFFVTLLGVMAVSGVLADLINLPGIVGAFLAGLSVNAAVQDHPAREKLDFFGKALFIPSFFIVTGFLIAPVAFVKVVVDNFPLVVGMIAALLVGKWIAAAVVGRVYGYTRPERLTVWALTLPQVAATLAATLVGYDTMNAAGQRLLDGRILNTVLVLLLTTSILGPILTERFAHGYACATHSRGHRQFTEDLTISTRRHTSVNRNISNKINELKLLPAVTDVIIGEWNNHGSQRSYFTADQRSALPPRSRRHAHQFLESSIKGCLGFISDLLRYFRDINSGPFEETRGQLKPPAS
jgi:hypothetical protein